MTSRGEYRNQPFTDFSAEENREALRTALGDVQSKLGDQYPLIIGGERLKTAATFRSVNPADPRQIVGIHQMAGKAEVERAFSAATTAFQTWSRTPASERADLLFRCADILQRRKSELTAWLVYEVGKNWVEADADWAEAVDFLEYYGREMIRLSGPRPITPYPGEENEYFYIPLGVGVIIPPWNFPLAIMAGMTMAAVVTGNTVILKPSEDAPTICARFMEVLEEAGAPAGVVNYVTGMPEEIGDLLTGDPRTRFISFTGSRDVGLHITSLAAQPKPGQKWIKRIVTEMGGKDAIIVDETADLDAAADGVATSAFGFQGQKCSACSRAIVVDEVYEAFTEKLLAASERFTTGPVVDGEHIVGPLINPEALQKAMTYIGYGKSEGELLRGGDRLESEGHFVNPTIFGDVPRDGKLATDEIFAPVLAVIRARDFDDALDIANGTDYGLTGAVFTGDEARIQRARDEFHVGNLYFNRKCTGALVGVQPFGGFNLSGTDSKAGGPDYLLHFLQGKSVCRKT